MKRALPLALPLCMLLIGSEALPASDLKVQIGNKDDLGTPEIYQRFIITAETSPDGELSKSLNSYALVVFPMLFERVLSIRWEYSGPPAEFVLYPASDKPLEATFRGFQLCSPGDLNVTMVRSIQKEMKRDLVKAWKEKVPAVIKCMEDIFDQTTEDPEVLGDLSSTPLRRYFLSLIRECCASKGWDDAWDLRQVRQASLLDAYYDRIHEQGLLLMKHAAPCCDAHSRKCLVDGADSWFRSHVRRRTDAWRECAVKDASTTLSGWDPEGDFAAEVLGVLKSLQVHYDASESSAQGLKVRMTQRISNYLPGWDSKKRQGLEKLKDLLETKVSNDDNALDTLGDMKLSAWEDMLDALKLLYDT